MAEAFSVWKIVIGYSVCCKKIGTIFDWESNGCYNSIFQHHLNSFDCLNWWVYTLYYDIQYKSFKGNLAADALARVHGSASDILCIAIS